MLDLKHVHDDQSEVVVLSGEATELSEHMTDHLTNLSGTLMGIFSRQRAKPFHLIEGAIMPFCLPGSVCRSNDNLTGAYIKPGVLFVGRIVENTERYADR